MAETRHGWNVEHGVTCVVCPGCAFTMDASHLDASGERYTCPSCESLPEPSAERDRVDALLSRLVGLAQAHAIAEHYGDLDAVGSAEARMSETRKELVALGSASHEPDARYVVVLDGQEVAGDYLAETCGQARGWVDDLVSEGYDRSRLRILPVGTGPRVEPVAWRRRYVHVDLDNRADSWSYFDEYPGLPAYVPGNVEVQIEALGVMPDPAPRPAQEDDDG